MKKKTLQLDKKLILRKAGVVALNPEQLPDIQGGATGIPCNQTIQCPVTQFCNPSVVLSCNTRCPGCRSFDIRDCISHKITPGCH
ncbi:class I lanthipeptide [Taibaiella koreensis]|uniref:class I lanthipeptide n=1 Tax=Taibaiella koreensis TaxID=1268548 RepID=UPI0013C30267|nr:class I lanthipeptide [Taibaiella koreensis]